MDKHQAHLDTLRRLEEEATNLQELESTYLQTLVKHFPKLTEERIHDNSNILRSLQNKIENNKRQREYAERNYTTMSAVITNQLYKLNSQVESTIEGGGVDLTKRLPSEIIKT